MVITIFINNRGFRLNMSRENVPKKVPVTKALRNRFREYRTDKRLSAQYVAEKLGYRSKSSITDFEWGRRKTVKIDFLQKLEDLYGVPGMERCTPDNSQMHSNHPLYKLGKELTDVVEGQEKF